MTKTTFDKIGSAFKGKIAFTFPPTAELENVDITFTMSTLDDQAGAKASGEFIFSLGKLSQKVSFNVERVTTTRDEVNQLAHKFSLLNKVFLL